MSQWGRTTDPLKASDISSVLQSTAPSFDLKTLWLEISLKKISIRWTRYEISRILLIGDSTLDTLFTIPVHVLLVSEVVNSSSCACTAIYVARVLHLGRI